MEGNKNPQERACQNNWERIRGVLLLGVILVKALEVSMSNEVWENGSTNTLQWETVREGSEGIQWRTLYS